MNGFRFTRIVHEVYEPFLIPLGFFLAEMETSGREYYACFETAALQLLMSYEPGERFFDVVIRPLHDGHTVTLDDQRALRLEALNRAYMKLVPKDSLEEADRRFGATDVEDSEEARLIKAARELSLVLPLFMSNAE